MKQGQNARRSRSRAGAKRSGGGQQKGKNGNRSETRVKGNPKQLLEKYKSLARDALQGGDRVLAENYFQHADHYQRILNEWNGLSSGLFEEDGDDGGRGRGRHRRGRGPAVANGQERPDPGAGEQPPEIRDEQHASKETGAETGDRTATTAEGGEGKAAPEGATGPAESPVEAGTDTAGDGAGADAPDDAPEAQAEPARPKPRRRRSTRTRAAATEASADAEPLTASEDNAPA